jgi:hypothetical protein
MPLAVSSAALGYGIIYACVPLVAAFVVLLIVYRRTINLV